VRILFVVHWADFFLTHRLPVALAARAAGYDVEVATPPKDSVGRIKAEGFQHHAFPMGRQSMAPWRELRSLFALIRLYRRVRPDVVHQVALKCVLYGTIAARVTGVPKIVNAVTGLGYLFSQPGIRGAMLRTTARAVLRPVLRSRRVTVIFQNPDDLSEFVKAGIVEPSQAVLIRGSGVDMRRFTPVPEPLGTPLVVFASRMLWAKGVAEFVEGARVSKARGIDARFVLVGDTDDNPAAVSVEQLAQWEKSGVVEWWGQRSDMPQVFAQSAVAVLPSIYREGVPKVLIEAAACGRPIVTTDMPGCREIVRDGVNGFLVPVRNATAVADAVERLLADDRLRKRMGHASRDLAVREFAVEVVVRSTLQLYPDPAVRGSAESHRSVAAG
jgi:glycosyltransferase involved in cell wall biosynthesis